MKYLKKTYVKWKKNALNKNYKKSKQRKSFDCHDRLQNKHLQSYFSDIWLKWAETKQKLIFFVPLRFPFSALNSFHASLTILCVVLMRWQIITLINLFVIILHVFCLSFSCCHNSTSKKWAKKEDEKGWEMMERRDGAVEWGLIEIEWNLIEIHQFINFYVSFQTPWFSINFMPSNFSFPLPTSQ